jgi:hypothetical protein
MATDYTSNSRSISVVAYDPFDRVTGDPGNIDDIIGATEGNFLLSGNSLIVSGRQVGALDHVGMYTDDDTPVALTSAEIAAGWTEA